VAEVEAFMMFTSSMKMAAMLRSRRILINVVLGRDSGRAVANELTVLTIGASESGPIAWASGRVNGLHSENRMASERHFSTVRQDGSSSDDRRFT